MRKMQRMLHIGGSAVFTALLASGCMSGAALGLVNEPLDGFPRYRGTAKSVRRRPPR